MADKSMVDRLIENTPLAIVVIGLLLFILGAAGTLPKTELKIDSSGWRIALAVMGGILVGIGLLFLWREKIHKGSREEVSASAIEEISPKDIQAEGKAFAKDCDGKMYWFNVPLGRCIPPHFDDFLRPAIISEHVTQIVFMLDITVKPTWDMFVAPAVDETERAFARGTKVKVHFHNLKTAKPVSYNMAFKMMNVDSPGGKKPEAHVFFYDGAWVKSISVKGREELMPTRMIKVRPGPDLFNDLKELCDCYSFEQSHIPSDVATPTRNDGTRA